MKKFLLFSMMIFGLIQPNKEVQAQTGSLDTVRNDLTLKVADWYLAQSVLAVSKDSDVLAESWKISAAVKASNRQLATEVLVEDLPGQLLFWLYKKAESMNRAQSRVLGDRIYTRIRAINNNVLQYYIGGFDATQQAPVEAEIREGRIHTLQNN
jgi:hypothetical protein